MSLPFDPLAHLLYGLAWVSFGLAHSWLAGPAAERRFKPLFGAWWRIAYNVISTVHFLLVMAIGGWLLPAAQPLPLPDWGPYALGAVGVLGAVLLVWFATYYDGMRLLGLTQLKGAHEGHPESDEEPLHRSGPHRYIRHPLYSAGILLFWGLAFTEAGLATAIWATLYFWLGSRHEERKLTRLFGEDYQRYRNTVPALIPWKGRAWRQ